MTMTELAEATDRGEVIEPMTVDSIDQRELAGQLLAQAEEQNIELVGPDGLLGQLTKDEPNTAYYRGGWRVELRCCVSALDERLRHCENRCDQAVRVIRPSVCSSMDSRLIIT
jgi:hypothetical protein